MVMSDCSCPVCGAIIEIKSIFDKTLLVSVCDQLIGLVETDESIFDWIFCNSYGFTEPIYSAIGNKVVKNEP